MSNYSFTTKVPQEMIIIIQLLFDCIMIFIVQWAVNCSVTSVQCKVIRFDSSEKNVTTLNLN